MLLRRIAISGPALVLLLGALPSLAAPPPAAADAADPRVLIERAARDYLEGWYTADPTRIGRALHPDLVKRYVDALPSGRQVVHTLSRDQMVEMTRAGGGSKTPAEQRKISVQVLAVSGDIAVAQASSSEYIEFLSLAKINGEWSIVNVLWRFASPQPPRR
jgi:hypothetical protein